MPLNITARLGLDAKGFKAGAEQARQTASNLKKKVGGEFKTMAAGMAGMFAAAAIVSKIQETVEWGTKVRDLASAFGMTTGHVQKLGYAASQTGVELEVVMDAHKDLGKSTGEALAGVEGKIWAFKALGISVNEIAGKNIDQVFMRVAKAINESGPILTPDQAKAIEDLGGGAMFQLINMMRSDLPEMFAKLEAGLGLVDDAAIQRLGRIGDAMAEFKTQNTGVWADIVGVVYGAIIMIGDYWTSLFDVLGSRLNALFMGVSHTAKGLSALLDGLMNKDLGKMKVAQLELTEASLAMGEAIGGDRGRKGAQRALTEIEKAGGGVGALLNQEVAGGLGSVLGGLYETLLSPLGLGQVGRVMKGKRAKRGEGIEMRQEGEGKDEINVTAAAAKERMAIAEKLKKLDEEAEKRRFNELSTTAKMLEVQKDIAKEKAKLFSKENLGGLRLHDQKAMMAEIKRTEERDGKEAADRELLGYEQEILAYKESQKKIAELEDQESKLKETKDKELKAKQAATPAVELAGEAKFGSMARIGGALGGRNPVLDMAKQQLAVQKENLVKVAETATAVGVIAGTK